MSSTFTYEGGRTLHLIAFSWHNIGATAAIRDDGGLLEADDERSATTNSFLDS